MVRSVSVRARLRWLTHRPFVAATYVMVLVAFGLVVAAAAPAVARSLGWTEVHTVSRSSARGTSAENAGIDAMHEKERLLGLDDDDGIDLDLDVGRSAVVRTKTQVYEVAPEASTTHGAPAQPKAALGTLAPGAVVRVMGQRGAYYHVLYDDQGEAEIGWIAIRDVAVRTSPPPAGSGHHR